MKRVVKRLTNTFGFRRGGYRQVYAPLRIFVMPHITPINEDLVLHRSEHRDVRNTTYKLISLMHGIQYTNVRHYRGIRTIGENYDALTR